MKASKKVTGMLAVVLIISFGIAIIMGGSILGLAGFFHLIGVTYESTGTLFLFLVYCFVVGIVFEIVEVIILFQLRNTTMPQWSMFIWTICIKFGLIWAVIHIVNELMTTIHLTWYAEIYTALLIVAIDMAFDDNKKSAAA